MVDLNDLRQLASLLEKLNELEKYQKMEKDYEILKQEREELLEYKRRYLAIVGIVNWGKDETTVEEVVEPIKAEEIDPSVRVIETNGKTYGETARNIRKSRRLTIREVAKQCDLASCTVWEIENDAHKNNEGSKAKFEKGMGVKIIITNLEPSNGPKVVKLNGRLYGEVIREERTLQGFTLNALANVSHVRPQTICDAEHNKHNTTHSVKTRLEKALGITVVE